MPFVDVKCPSCGGEIQLDNTRAFGFCLYCGAKIINTERSQDLDALFKKAKKLYYQEKNYLKAFEYFSNIAQFDPGNWEAIFLRDFTNCFISPYKDDPVSLAINNTKKTYEIVKANIPDTFEHDKLKRGLLKFVLAELPTFFWEFNEKWNKYKDPNIEFENADGYQFFLRDIHNGIRGCEYFLSLVKNKTDPELISPFPSNIYGFLAYSYNLLSKHHKITNGKWVSVDSQERKIVVAKWNEYQALEEEMYTPVGIIVTPGEYWEVERRNIESRILEEERQAQEREQREQDRIKQEQKKASQMFEQKRQILEEKKQKVATLPKYMQDLKAAEANLEDVKKHKGLFGGKRVTEAEQKVKEIKDQIAYLEMIKAEIESNL